jgi:high-affinity Fe2+/Pb2+ permease
MGRNLGKNRLLGDSTTVLGLITALLAGFLIQVILPYIPAILIGFGMYLGHMCGSFIKRRLSIQSGEFFPVLDHGDGIIVTGGMLYLLGYITLPVYFISIATTLICYPIICYVAYKLKLREKPL